MRKEASELLAFHFILKYKSEIENNPFENLPKESLEKALEMLESMEGKLTNGNI